jgi:hypothetical protein
MSVTARAVHAAVVVAGLLGISGMSATAAAQRYQRNGPRTSQPPRAYAPPPRSARTAPSHPRIGVAAEPRPNVDQRSVWTLNRNQRVSPQHRFGRVSTPAIVYYIPVPSDGGYGSYGYGGGVYDTDGRPLYAAYEMEVARQSVSPITLPDLNGSPYVVTEGGAMVVDFGDGYRRTVPSCAVVAAAATPDGHPRTIFYQGPADGIILRAGSTGRVRGTPAGSANVCYAVDPYGRTELRY